MPSRPPAATDGTAPDEVALSAMPGWVAAGVGVLFVVACAFGVLEVHYSNDTWIALSAGRQILTEPQFPTKDTFSYTFYGQTWFNQNWLSHVYFWLLYDQLGPTAVVLGSWLLGVATFTFVLLATRLRCGSWAAAILAGALVATACRDWLSIRPATVQFFLLAAAWLAFSALAAAGARRRWWPIVLLLFVYGVWPHAHGSFLFGFGLLGLFVACAVVPYFFRRRPTLSFAQLAAVIGVGLVAVLLGALVSPYGVENFTHPFKVVESEKFRTVGEWLSPFVARPAFPGTRRFWMAVAIAAAAPLIMLLLRGWDRLRGLQPVMTYAVAPPLSDGMTVGYATTSGRGGPMAQPPIQWQLVLFDLAAVGIGLGMALFARRFAPIFYILATPALTTWTLRLGRSLSLPTRNWARDAVFLGAWAGAAALGWRTVKSAYSELVTDVPTDAAYNLLDRVTRNVQTPRQALEFLKRNQLTPNVMTEWKVAGAVMFEVPGARVFIDGRAQQVYSEDHYLAYLWLLGPLDAAGGRAVARLLDKHATEVVLLPKWGVTKRLSAVIDGQPEWIPVLDAEYATLWVRAGSPLLAELGRRERAGTLWWPDDAGAQLQRGLLMLTTEPQDLPRALELWRATLQREPAIGVRAYPWITGTLVRIGAAGEAAELVREWRERHAQAIPGLSDATQSELQAALRECERILAGAPGQ
ncbi:MAG: hypothetical protein KA383_00085 [Phycisphaerae bacterium]|nr:hypothetical protein [Phycisphaerae bacterium]